jgi:hypothetical protein
MATFLFTPDYAVYSDIFVEREFSEETARLLGPSLRVWCTNEFTHSGLRDDGYRVLGA